MGIPVEPNESGKSGSKVEYLYRYETTKYYGAIGVTISLHRHRIVSKTPKGFWISHFSYNFPQKDKWVSASARKRFAYPTQEEALENFMYRKIRHIKILESRLRDAKYAFQEGLTLLEEDEREKFQRRLEIRDYAF